MELESLRSEILKRRVGAALLRRVVVLGILGSLGWMLPGCGKTDARNETTAQYVDEINAWRTERIERLKEPTGWLSLAGLYWLKNGSTTFGADDSNAIVFPGGAGTPGRLGTFVLTGEKLTVEIAPDAVVTHDGREVSSITMHHDQDPDHEPTILETGSLSWYAIKRGERIGIRLRDGNSERLRKFEGIDSYPVDPRWRIDATLIPHTPPKTIVINDVLGNELREPSPGTLSFMVDGKTCTLDPIGEPEDKVLFVVFGDKTSGTDTYGGGRFLLVEAPGEDGKVVIDFNKAYNPPCAFSPYATCPLPPEQNLLPVAVTAGEKTYRDAAHTSH